MVQVAVNDASSAENNCRELVKAEIERTGMTQGQAAKEAGVTPARLSQWLSDKYKGDNETLEAEMRRWLKQRTERATGAARLPEAPEWVDTATGKRVLAALSYAQVASDISVIYGGAGLGKTCAARNYQRTHPNVWIATMTPSTASVATCFERIVFAVGLRDSFNGAARNEAAIISRIMGTAGLLVIDEAQHLSTNALEGIRSLHDATDVGLVLMGNESVYAQMTGGARQAHFAQLFSRIGRKVRLNTPQSDDVSALLSAWNVGSNARNVCLKIAKQPGALRGLTKTLRLAAMMAASEAVSMEAEHIKAAWHELGGTV
jgi:DNA transposition AAA+ family ATPase